MIKLSESQARVLTEAAKSHAGITIASDKISFLEMRVGRRLREIGCDSFESYISLLKGPHGVDEARCVAESLTTHTTSFFREKGHFDWLESEGLPALCEGGAGKAHKLTIWSAACSLGSEMWSAAMVVDQFSKAQKAPLSWEVVGTDVSRRILQRASAAVFTEDEIAGLPETLRRNYLMRSRKDAGVYRITRELRNRARLAWANLVQFDQKVNVLADVALLRNVLIYFQPDDRHRAVQNVAARIRHGGYLLTGHSEHLDRLPSTLRQISVSIYQKVS